MVRRALKRKASRKDDTPILDMKNTAIKGLIKAW